MSKRIVLVDVFGYELFSGESVASDEPAEPATTPATSAVSAVSEANGARQGGPLESGIFFRGAPRLRKTA